MMISGDLHRKDMELIKVDINNIYK